MAASSALQELMVHCVNLRMQGYISWILESTKNGNVVVMSKILFPVKGIEWSPFFTFKTI